MLTKTIKIDGKPITFGASASVVRLYRAKFGHDIIRDMAELQKGLNETNINAGADGLAAASALPPVMLEMFENLAYSMAKVASPDTVPESPEDWLDGFSLFSIYMIAPELIKLWEKSVQTHAKPKKK